MAELLLGCGNSRAKKVRLPGTPEDFEDLTTLDIDPLCFPAVVFDLDDIEDTPLPFITGMFDEVHAYEVLEHLGQQGQAGPFFALFGEIWRVLKPGGLLCGTCPSLDSAWLWGDPGHRRVISRESLTFLDQMQYAQVGQTAMTDYRWCYAGDFELVADQSQEGTYLFALRAHKPARRADAVPGDLTI